MISTLTIFGQEQKLFSHQGIARPPGTDPHGIWELTSTLRAFPHMGVAAVGLGFLHYNRKKNTHLWKGGEEKKRGKSHSDA